MHCKPLFPKLVFQFRNLIHLSWPWRSPGSADRTSPRPCHPQAWLPEILTSERASPHFYLPEWRWGGIQNPIPGPSLTNSLIHSPPLNSYAPHFCLITDSSKPSPPGPKEAPSKPFSQLPRRFLPPLVHVPDSEMQRPPRRHAASPESQSKHLGKARGPWEGSSLASAPTLPFPNTSSNSSTLEARCAWNPCALHPIAEQDEGRPLEVCCLFQGQDGNC